LENNRTRPKLKKEEYFCFQNNSASFYKANSIQSHFEENFPYFLSSDNWPAFLLDLISWVFFDLGYMA
jgi:hypothetical protein